MAETTTESLLKQALGHAKKAARAIDSATDYAVTDGPVDPARYAYYRNDAIAQLEFALTALRAAK